MIKWIIYEDRPRQLHSVRQRDLCLVCLKMASENVGERMMASVALTVNDRVVKKEDYSWCGPRRKGCSRWSGQGHSV